MTPQPGTNVAQPSMVEPAKEGRVGSAFSRYAPNDYVGYDFLLR